MVNKLKFALAPIAVAAATSIPAFAETSQAVTALTTGMTTIAADVMTAVAAVLPIGLGIAGTFIVIRLGMKFFKTVSKG